ncbi:unnamed protein product [Sphagnum jensenii]|uniref:Baseplate protein J-like domain-containing protein n=1 Tax=Sphagnum jensenii TaxID=128206 RepID=A0ABP0V969_9BRYO
MPNQITSAGLQTASQAELLAYYTAQFQTIYGASIDLSSSSPDGQMINIFIQSVLDLEDLITNVYNMFDPDNAIGAVLDQRVAINGIQRLAGTYSTTNITIVTSQACTLYGLNQTVQPVFTVADNAGNNWQLQTTQAISGAGTYIYLFQAQNPGAISTIPNTITVPVTIVLGVTSINNPTTYANLGINEETDAALRVRRQQSVSLASQGYLQGLVAALNNINGLDYVQVYENLTGTTNGDGVPGHSIWVVVAGSGSASNIATAIYQKRNAGCGMFGAVTYTITQIDGSPFIISWDVVVPESVFIKFTATSLNGTALPQIAAIKAGLLTGYIPGVNQEINVNALATAVQVIDPNTLVTNAGFSTTVGGSYTSTLSPTSKKYQFVFTSANIVILPMILTPVTSSVTHLTTQQMTGLGGYGTLVYSISVNNSGGIINSSSGLYTAGTAGFADTILVTDSLSNTATATVNVI